MSGNKDKQTFADLVYYSSKQNRRGQNLLYLYSPPKQLN